MTVVEIKSLKATTTDKNEEKVPKFDGRRWARSMLSALPEAKVEGALERVKTEEATAKTKSEEDKTWPSDIHVVVG